MGKWKLEADRWLRERCDKLSIRQRKAIIYGICLLYLFCCCVILWQLFNHKERESFSIPQGQLLDSPLQKDTIYDNITLNHYGNETKRTA